MTSRNWRNFGGINQYEKNNNVSFNNLTADNLIVKNPYVGNFTISGELVVNKNTIFNSDLNFNGNIDVRNDSVFRSNLIVKQNLTVEGTLNLDKNIRVDDSIYVNNNIYIGNDNHQPNIFLNSTNNKLGLNVSAPTATLDISGGAGDINTLKMKSGDPNNVNVISINNSNRGITVFTDVNKNAIQFWNTIPMINPKQLDNQSILNNSRENASITYDSTGNITLDCSNNTFIASDITIGSSGGNPASHLLNETALILESSYNEYLYNYYETNKSLYNSGSALTLLSATDSSSNVGINLVNKSKKGMSINGGDYINDITRSVGTINLFDVCGESFPVQMSVSGINKGHLKTTTGFNTIKPDVDNYSLCVNGPIKITHDEIHMIKDVDFQVNFVVSSNKNKQFAIMAGYQKSYSNTIDILYTINGGKTWLKSNFSDISNNFFLNKGYIYTDSDNYHHCFLCGTYGASGFWLKSKFDYSGTGLIWTSGSTYDNMNTKFTDIVFTPNYNKLYVAGDNTINVLNYDLSTVTTDGAINKSVKSLNIYNNKLFLAGDNTFEMYDITNDMFTSLDTQHKYNAINVSDQLIVAVGDNIISYIYTSDTSDSSNLANKCNKYHITEENVSFNQVYVFNQNVIAVGNNGVIYYSNTRDVNRILLWINKIPDNFGMANVLQSHNLSSVTMTDNNTFLISSTYKITDFNINGFIVTSGHSKLFYCYWPNLFNYSNNCVLDVDGVTRLYGDVSMNSRLDVHGITTFYDDVLINSNGNSSTTPMTGALVVSGGVGVGGNINIGTNLKVTGNANINSTEVSTSSNSGALVVSGGLGVGGNINIGNNLNVTGTVTGYSFYATSDYRIKKEIISLNETPFNVDDIRPVYYYNKLTHKKDIGFIAHEIQEIYPFLVNGEKDGKENQSVQYMGLIGLMIKEIQELKKINKSTNLIIENLNKKILQQDLIVQSLIHD